MAFQGVEHAPLLPASLEDRLKQWGRRVLGILLLLGVAVASLSLLSWSAADPSLTRATNAPIHNLLGSLGAILSDLLLQMLGLAGVFAVLPSMFWALQLIGREPVSRWRRKLMLTPIGLVLVAGAFSALPVPSAWPVHHGLGGLLGDAALTLLTNLLAPINPGRAAAAAGLFLFAGGVVVLLASLGLSQADLKRMCQQRPRITLWDVTGSLQRLGRSRRERKEPVLAPPTRPEPMFHVEPSLDQEPAERTGTETSIPFYDLVPGRGSSFDDSTDMDSRAIAERFAPGSVGRSEPRFEHVLASPVEFAVAPGPSRGNGFYRRPPLSMLKRAPAAADRAEGAHVGLHNQARQLADVLSDFGVRGEMKGIHPGVVTLFEFEPARGVKTARVAGLADDIARSLGAAAARVAVVPGRNAIGIELPSLRREKVFLRELIPRSRHGVTADARQGYQWCARIC
jgi:S-DNA-T family DNA segregation ATPase FtsK/SpoIIIE